VSRAPKHIRRRRVLLSAIIAAAVVGQFWSYSLSLTANGLTLTCLLIASAAFVAAVYDGRSSS
jgi:hypothetical protein